jgi:hypothetical protein
MVKRKVSKAEDVAELELPLQEATVYAFDKETNAVFVSHSEIDTKTLAVATGLREACFEYIEELDYRVKFGNKFKNTQETIEWCHEYIQDMLKKHGVDLTIFE